MLCKDNRQGGVLFLYQHTRVDSSLMQAPGVWLSFVRIIKIHPSFFFTHLQVFKALLKCLCYISMVMSSSFLGVWYSWCGNRLFGVVIVFILGVRSSLLLR